MGNDDTKAGRILSMYDLLRKGYVLNKSELASEFEVTLKTVQRDLEEIRTYMADRNPSESVVYDHRKKGYLLDQDSGDRFSALEAFALIKIVLESRAFNTAEMERLLDLLCYNVSRQEQQAFRDLVVNERFHYQPVAHGRPLLSMIWDLGQCVMKREVIEIAYKKMNGDVRQRIVYPQAIVFSEFYFYMIAQIEGSDYKDPAYYRIDRIEKFRLMDRKFAYRRFEDGELKKRIQFMHGGELFRLHFKYKGPSLEAIMDRFPTARVITQNECETIIEAEVFGKGCLMWLLSQGERVELFGPAHLREEMREKVEGMYRVYQMQ